MQLFTYMHAILVGMKYSLKTNGAQFRVEGFRKFLFWGPLRRIRRNHGLEHATVHVLQERFSELRISGYSHEGGFVLLGNLPEGAAETAVTDALARLQAGQKQLAIHPQCGTNFAVQSLLYTLVGFFGFAGTHPIRALKRFNGVSLVMFLATLAALPIGLAIQAEITTESDMGSLHIAAVKRQPLWLPWIGPFTLHFIRTQKG